VQVKRISNAEQGMMNVEVNHIKIKTMKKNLFFTGAPSSGREMILKLQKLCPTTEIFFPGRL
jgi:hypothetical protein